MARFYGRLAIVTARWSWERVIPKDHPVSSVCPTKTEPGSRNLVGMYAGASLHIDAGAIAQNTRHIAARTGAAVMAVVKADGFGHGDAALAALSDGATWLGVTSIDEALPFRWRGIGVPMLSWLNPLDADFAAAIRHYIDLAVPSLRHLASIQMAAQRVGRPAQVHLHIDSGMSRDGIDRAEWNALCELARLGEAAGLLKVRGIMSHLARADRGDPATRHQTLLFENAVRAARHRRLDPSVLHLAATAAALTERKPTSTWSGSGPACMGSIPRIRPVCAGR